MTPPRASADELDRELARQLLSERWLPVLAHLIVLALLLPLVWGALPLVIIVLWSAAVMAVVGVRGVLWRWARQRALSPHRIALATRATMVALGLSWGAGTAFAAPYLSANTLVILLMTLAGLLSAGIATLVADRWVFPLYSTAMFGPVLAGLLVAPQHLGASVFILLVVFLGFTIRLHRRAHEMLRERLRVESMLRTREGQLAAAQAIAHVGSWEWDIRADGVTWSAELYRIYGLPIGSPASFEAFLACVHPEDRARVKSLVEGQIHDHQPVDYEWRVQRPDGGVRTLHSRQIVVGDGGRDLRMLGTSHDITERKAAEERLQTALGEVKTLRGILPICAECKRVRTEDGGWEQIESYVRTHSHAEFSHGLCPDCAKATWGAVV